MEKEAHIEPVETREKKHKRNWKESKIIFLVIPVVLTVFVPCGGIAYLCGRLNCHLGVICVFYPIVFGFIIYCFFVGALRLFRDWKKVDRWRKFLILAQICVPVLFFVIFIKPSVIPIKSVFMPPAQIYNYGLRDRIKSKADIKAIRNWLRTLDREDCGKFGDVKLHRDKWSNSLRVLKPLRVNLYIDGNDNPKVILSWGGGFFHWCVEIGMEDMEIPLSELEGLSGCWLLVEPGVYVYNW
jgi:hypothetical protein